MLQSKPVTDRRSKFIATLFHVESEEEVRNALKTLMKKKKYLKATHNIYAFRLKTLDKKIIEKKKDDGETGAGIRILNLLRKNESVNILIIVTRWYGGVHLGSDRFKHIVNTAKEVLELTT